MKFCRYFFLLILIQALSANAKEPFIPTLKPYAAFRAGENLTYQMKYGIIEAGVATLSLTDDTCDKKTVFRAKTIARTTGLADKLYGVEDIYESWFDQKTNLPYRQIRDISEGRYKKYNDVTFNHDQNTVYSKITGVHSAVPAKVLDLSSTFYYIRRIDFSKVKEKDVFVVNMYFGDEVSRYYFTYRGKETIRTKFGKIRCIKICPVVETGRMFKTPNDLTVWFTDDSNCLPVLVEMDLRYIGSVLLKLIQYENIASPMVAK
jgi:hypothetical protein